MDFDEYDYLEKAVEDQDDKETKKAKKSESERNEKSSRKREVDEEAGSGGRVDEELKVKRSKSEHENGKEDRDHSGRARDRHRRDREEETDGVKERDRERNRTRDRGSSEKERDRDRDREERDRERHKEKEKEKERERDKDRRDKERDRERHKEKDRERDKDRRDKEREREKEKERERREREKREREREEERSRRSRSRSVREKEREVDVRENRRMKEKKDMVEPEADPERDQRTVFAYQMPLKATERDVYEFFSKAGKVRDVRLIMDRNSRRSKGVGYVEFYDAMSVPMAIALSGQLLFGQPVMVKPSEAEKNLVQSNTSGASGAGPYGAVDRKLYVGNLHFNMTETHLREIFEAFGPVELVQLPLDLESGHCKGFGFVQFAHLEHAKAAQSLNGKLEIAGRTIKVSSVTDHIGAQENVAKSNDLDDDEGGGLALNAQSRALLMQKLDRTGIATSIAGSLGAPVLNASAPNQRATSLPLNGQAAVAAPVLPANFTPPVLQSVGSPSECLLLKNMFDPSTETAPDFDLEIKEDVEEECSKYGHVKHIYVDKNSAGCVYLQYDTVEAAINAQRAMHLRWFAGRQISVLFMQPQVYEAKFIGA
ncbi:RNA-binding protein 39-like isoform X1 [Cucurbita moschata]|uniref:RNA-binding protein 39-like isoform X1 n=1 Tax=Cucurbita moschata TaxID=3662 RepID=A0A6J1GD19_CUCMO|nr:RNA-binding protein 39-like isoform X1 [Cucurbita moschata]